MTSESVLHLLDLEDWNTVACRTPIGVVRMGFWTPITPTLHDHPSQGYSRGPMQV